MNLLNKVRIGRDLNLIQLIFDLMNKQLYLIARSSYSVITEESSHNDNKNNAKKAFPLEWQTK